MPEGCRITTSSSPSLLQSPTTIDADPVGVPHASGEMYAEVSLVAASIFAGDLLQKQMHRISAVDENVYSTVRAPIDHCRLSARTNSNDLVEGVRSSELLCTRASFLLESSVQPHFSPGLP